mmetsp:Transcript_28024/g.41381  ORF Transcript_28024/g.41381 Transcript_28024/m.41381 type:complete len:329 (-) Transcript_28024:152-1138(-)
MRITTLSCLLLSFHEGSDAFSSMRMDGTNPNDKAFQRPHNIINYNENIPLGSTTPPPTEAFLGYESTPKWWEGAGTHESAISTNEGFIKTYTDRSKEISQDNYYEPKSSSAWWDNPGKSLHERSSQTTHEGAFQTQTDLAREIAHEDTLAQQQQQQAGYYRPNPDNYLAQETFHQNDAVTNEISEVTQSQQVAGHSPSYDSYVAPNQGMSQPQMQPRQQQQATHQEMFRTHSDDIQKQERLLKETLRSTGQQWWDQPGNYDPSMATNEGNFQTQTEIEKERSVREQNDRQQHHRNSNNWWDKPGNHEDSYGFMTETERKKSNARKFSP